MFLYNLALEISSLGYSCPTCSDPGQCGLGRVRRSVVNNNYTTTAQQQRERVTVNRDVVAE